MEQRKNIYLSIELHLSFMILVIVLLKRFDVFALESQGLSIFETVAINYEIMLCLFITNRSHRNYSRQDKIID